MSNEIRGVATSGTLYAVIMNESGQFWNGSSFESYTGGNYSTYAVSMTEQGTSNIYFADFPSGITTGGVYEYIVYRQAGGSPAQGDTPVATGKIDWTGTVAVTAVAGSMTGSDFRDYVLRKGFKRTDKDTELYEAVTDAIQEWRRRFDFDEAEVETTTTDTITTLGDFKIDVESDNGLLLGVIMEDGTTAQQLIRRSKSEFDQLYPDHNVTNDRGYPADYMVFAGSIYIGPIPDDTSYSYRLSYSKSAGTVTSSTTGVPFTALYRDVLALDVLSRLYEMLEEYDKANYYRAEFESKWIDMTRRERANAGDGTFIMEPTSF